MKTKTRGYIFVLLAVSIFAAQDGFTKFLGDRYPPIMVTMVRFWAFAVFVTILAAASPGGLRKAVATRRPGLQIMRGVLLVAEIVVTVFAFTHAGLAMSQAIFQATPLLVTLLSVPLLGEKVGWRRATAVVAGLFGVLVILNPVGVHFDLSLLLPLTAAFMFAIYSVATRAVSRYDSAVTSVFYAGVAGAAAISLVGPFYWTAIQPADWWAMAALCICGTLSHYCLIRSYGLLEAVEVQPITYLQLVLSVIVAVLFFNESVGWNMMAGAVIVVGAGLFTVLREHHLEKRRAAEGG
ncbi:MAG: DMT family transporter [Rhizobiales bacterium]|nr:DMT family transporter [Hyphomicrobiales bacterium]